VKRPPLRRSHRRLTSSPYAARGAVDLAAAAAVPQAAAPVARDDPLRRQLGTQTFETSLPSLLRYADRSSMAWSRSREVRLPYPTAASPSSRSRCRRATSTRDGVTKRILRDFGRGIWLRELVETDTAAVMTSAA